MVKWGEEFARAVPLAKTRAENNMSEKPIKHMYAKLFENNQNTICKHAHKRQTKLYKILF